MTTFLQVFFVEFESGVFSNSTFLSEKISNHTNLLNDSDFSDISNFLQNFPLS